jgi:hypothetical protein
MKKLITLLSIPLIAGLSACRDYSHDFCKYIERDDLIIQSERGIAGNILRIMEKEHINDFHPRYLTAKDNEPITDGEPIGDGRFDEIKLWGIPKGNELEKYANLDSVTKLYNEVKETGCNCGEKYNSQEQIQINPFSSPIPSIDDSTWDSMTKEQRDSVSREKLKKLNEAGQRH